MPDDALYRTIREKILSGDLPKKHCRTTWYGYGTHGICAACARAMGPHEVEVECDLPGGGTIRLHRTCYEIWSAEWPSCELPVG